MDISKTHVTYIFLSEESDIWVTSISFYKI